MRSKAISNRIHLIHFYAKKYNLNLKGCNVLTEAATGPFSATANLAAYAGANVYCVAKAFKNHSRESAIDETDLLARRLKVQSKIHFCRNSPEAPLEQIDIVTNSGHVRPMRKSWLRRLPSHAVVSLMMEPWEVRRKDLDIQILDELGLAYAGVNEQSSKVALFEKLGSVCERALRTHGFDCEMNQILLLGRSPFRPFVRKHFIKLGTRLVRKPENARAVIILNVFAKVDFKRTFSKLTPGVPIVQLWGDVPKKERKAKFFWIPEQAPRSGHMGLDLSYLGEDPVFELLAAGLRVGQILSKARREGNSKAESMQIARKTGLAL